MDEVILCADAESLMHPEMIGLDGCRLDAVPWLKVFSTGEEARAYARATQGGEVWAVSADDMEAINVAAALKHDDPLRTVCLVAADATGSVSSRAHAAHVDQMLTVAGFVQRFRAEHQRRKAQNNSAAHTTSTMGSSPQSAGVENAPAADPTMTVKLGAVGASSLAGQISSPSAVVGSVSAVTAVPSAAHSPASPVPGSIPAIGQTPVTGATPVSARTPTPASAIPIPAVPASAPPVMALAHPSGKSAFLLPVVSGSGGAGKSTVALCLALLAQALGHRTLLIDGDLQFGDIHTALALKNPITMAEVLQSSEPHALLHSTETLPALVAAPRKLEEAEVYAREMPRMIDVLMPHFDLIIVNTGNSWTDYHAPLLERASRTLFLIDQRASSVHAAQHALDVCLRSGIATSSFSFVLNRCSRNALLTSIDVSCALNGAHVMELKDGGSDVEELCGAGLALDLLSEKNDLRESLEEVISLLLPMKGQPSKKFKRSRIRGRAKDGGLRGERRGQWRAKHGKRDRHALADAMAPELPLAASR